MRFHKLWLCGALLLPNVATAATFLIDDILPGEGAIGDCFTALHKMGAKPLPNQDEVPNLFESIGNQAFIKINGQVHAVKLVAGTGAKGTPAVYLANGLKVTDNHVVTKSYKTVDDNTYYLKGTLTVAYRGQSQILKVQGIDYCYNGPN